MMRPLSASHLTLTAHTNIPPAAQRREICREQISMPCWWGNANKRWDVGQKLYERWRQAGWSNAGDAPTHTHTHSGLQQSEVSEPVRGLWLDTAPEQAGQKRCLSPLIKWFKIPCSPDSFHRRPMWTHSKSPTRLPGPADMNGVKRGRKAKFMAEDQGLKLSYASHAY